MTLMVCLMAVALVFVGYYCGGAGMERRPKHIASIVRPIPPSPLLRAVLEKRRVLERVREEILRGVTSLIELRRNLAITESLFDNQTRSGGNQIDQIDKQLLELADDEAALMLAETPEADEFAKDVVAPRCADPNDADALWKRLGVINMTKVQWAGRTRANPFASGKDKAVADEIHRRLARGEWDPQAKTPEDAQFALVTPPEDAGCEDPECPSHEKGTMR